MATYTQRPDGLYEVELDDGRLVPTALDPALLEAQGIGPKPPPMQPDLRTAGLGDLGTRPMTPGADALGASPAFGQLMSGGQQRLDAPPVPAGPPSPPPAPVQNMSVMPEGGMSREPPPAPSGTAPAPAPPSSADREAAIQNTAQQFMLAELARQGSPAQRIPGGERRDTVELKYKEYPALDPQVYEDISESRIDQQLANQEASEQSEYGKLQAARVSAQEARDLQRQVEATVSRKNAIETEVGKRLQGIEQRLAKARAVTESGSARERVMRDKGSFGRILAAIGLALGDFAALASGGRNFAREQIDKEVAEEMEREKQLYNVDPETSALKTYMEAWGSPESALKELELNKREAVQAQMEAWIRRSDAQMVPIEFRQWLANQALEIQQGKAALGESAATEVIEKWKNVPDKYVGGGGPVDPVKASERASKLADNLRNIEGVKKGEGDAAMLRIGETRAGRSVRTPSGEKLYAPDEKRAQSAEAQLYSVAHIQNNLSEIKSLMKKPYSELNLADRERINVLVQSTVTLGKEAEKLGALSGPDMSLITPLAGELAKLRLNPLNPDVKIEAGIDQASKHFARRALDAERGLYRDPDLTQPYRSTRPPSFREVE